MITRSTPLVALSFAALAVPSNAQTPIQANGQVLAAASGTVPGTAGAAYSVGGGAFDPPVVDAAGNVLFRAITAGGDTTATNGRAFMHATSSLVVSLMIRSGDQAPGLTPGVTLATSIAAPGFTPSYRVGPGGHTMWPSGLWNGGTTTFDNAGIFAGLPGGLTCLVRRNDAAPGTTGALFSRDFFNSTPLAGEISVNAAGQYVFRSTLSGGDTVATNNDGWWLGTPGSLNLLVRRGDVMLAPAGGYALSGIVGPTQAFAKLNAAGEVLWEAQLTGGAPALTTADDQALYLSTLFGHTLIAREGDQAPGLPAGVRYGVSTGQTVWGATGTSLDANGALLFRTHVRDGGTTTADDTAVFYRPPGGPTGLLFRENDQGPGLPPGVLFDEMAASTLQLNSSGRYAFGTGLRGAGVTTANNEAVWSGVAPAAPVLVGRKGDAAIGTAGAAHGAGSTTIFAFNDGNQLLLQTALVGGDVVGAANDTALFLWSPTAGSVLLAREGNALPQLGGTALSSWTIQQNDNAENGTLGFNNAGRIALRVTLVGGNQAVLVLDTKGPVGVPYCFGDGSGTACPCTPVPLVGDADKGCPNSFNPGGGKLVATGIASVSGDSLVMTCTLINNGGAVVFQGTTNRSGGLGTTFGDGLRCAAGTVMRMRSHAVTTNSYVYPDATFGDNKISIRGAVLAPGDRYYQGWYRSGLAHCNPAANFNLTNAVKVTWIP